MTTPQTIAPVRFDLTVRARRDHAFAVFTEQMGGWWPSSHHIGEGELAELRLEPFAGGRWYELTDRGAERDWGRVLTWDPPSRLVLGWQLDADFACNLALTTEVEVTFTEVDGGSTHVSVEHRDLERFGVRGLEMRESFGGPRGWTSILDGYRQAASAGG